MPWWRVKAMTISAAAFVILLALLAMTWRYFVDLPINFKRGLVMGQRG